jgi:hypothetical protein
MQEWESNMSKTKEWLMREGMDKMLDAEALIEDKQVAAVAQVMTAVDDLTQHLHRYHEEVEKLNKRIEILELAFISVRKMVASLDGNEWPTKGTKL